MIITFSKHDEHGNGWGSRLELAPMTPAEVHEMREQAKVDGFMEGRTRNLSDEELSKRTQGKVAK